MCCGHKITPRTRKSTFNYFVRLFERAHLSRRLWTGRIYVQMIAVNWCWCNAGLENGACADVCDVSLGQDFLMDFIIKSNVNVNEWVNKMTQFCLNVSLSLQSGTEIETVGYHTKQISNVPVPARPVGRPREIQVISFVRGLELQ